MAKIAFRKTELQVEVMVVAKTPSSASLNETLFALNGKNGGQNYRCRTDGQTAGDQFEWGGNLPKLTELTRDSHWQSVLQGEEWKERKRKKEEETGTNQLHAGVALGGLPHLLPWLAAVAVAVQHSLWVLDHRRRRRRRHWKEGGSGRAPPLSVSVCLCL